MARWRRTGSATSSLRERTPVVSAMIEAGVVDSREAETTLTEIIANLGLAPLSPADECTIRQELGVIIAAGEQRFADSPKHKSDGSVTVRRVQKTLRWIARVLQGRSSDAEQLDVVEQFLRGTETGLRTDLEIAVASTLISFLTRQLGDEEKSREMLCRFRTHPQPVADGCRQAAAELTAIRGRSGAGSIDWSGFRRALELVAERNGIKPVVTIDRRTHEAKGRFIEIAAVFEQLLPRPMRTQTRDALAKRLHRARPPRPGG
jgi:hypothetical protein